MKKLWIYAFVAGIFTLQSCETQKKITNVQPTFEQKAKHKEIKTPDDALAELKAGNKRFLNDEHTKLDYKNQIAATKDDQHPHSLILSCLDSRVPPEIIFDQGIGEVFVARVAGNIETNEILGSMEFATKVKGTKLIVVMGHPKCGAVSGAIDDAKLGNLTGLIEQIKPVVAKDKDLDTTAKHNVELTAKHILERSPVIQQLVNEGKVKIVSAFYDLETGKETIF